MRSSAARVRALLPVAALLAGCGREAAAPAPAASAAPPTTLSEQQLMLPLPSPLPRVVARVNGQDISLRNLAIMVVESIELGKEPEARRNALYRQGLERLIQREVLFEEAHARGIEADPLKVQAAYDQLRGHYADDHAWQDFLKSRSLTDDELRAEFRIRHTVEALLNAQAAQQQVTATDEEIQGYYDRADPGEFYPKGASPGPKPPLDAVRDQVRAQVVRDKHGAAIERFIAELEARARIERFL